MQTRTPGLHRVPAAARAAYPASGGFSLTEVLLCLAILPIALSSLLLLMEAGLSHTRESVESTESLQLAGMILAALDSEPFGSCRLFAAPGIPNVHLGIRTPSDPPLQLYAWTRKQHPATPPGERAHPPGPLILRTHDPGCEADYQILLRFEPSGRGGPSWEHSCRGTLAGIQILHHPSGRTVFQTQQFVARKAAF